MSLFDGYLKDVNIDELLKSKLIDMLKMKMDGNTNLMDSIVSDEIQKNIDNYSGNNKWVQCVDKCKERLKPLIDAEISSTAFMLRLLASSIVSVDETKKIVFKYTGNSNVSDEKKKPITGNWSEDSSLFNMSTNETNKTRRLIMGFGPSASGKTYWTKKIIEMLSKKDANFPTIFLSVDGGIARETSLVYQEIISVLEKNHPDVDGIKNLVSTSGGGSLFDSNKIKKSIKNYLNHVKDKGQKTIPISLYVPTTASEPSNPYSQYVAITGDRKWIGAYIWQHRNKCPFDDEFKCETTNKSGAQREKKEGKKFSSKAYKLSEINGLKFLRQAPGGRINIHNSGNKNKSIITEHGIRNMFLLDDELVQTHNGVYKRVGEQIGDVSIMATFQVERFGGTRRRRRRQRGSKKPKSRKYRSTRRFKTTK